MYLIQNETYQQSSEKTKNNGEQGAFNQGGSLRQAEHVVGFELRIFSIIYVKFKM